MIDHISLKVRDFGRCKEFYVAALAPLGYAVVKDFSPHAAGIGPVGRPVFWVVASGEATPTHIAFSSRDRDAVAAFHVAALTAGARDNGPPGVRAHYHESYFGAFVYDPEGNNIEAVCHRSPEEIAAATDGAPGAPSKRASSARPKPAPAPKRAKGAASRGARKPPALKPAARKRR